MIIFPPEVKRQNAFNITNNIDNNNYIIIIIIINLYYLIIIKKAECNRNN